MLNSGPGLRALKRVVRGHVTPDQAGLRLTRVIGAHELEYLDPFLMLDEFQSESSVDYVAGFPDRPHRGFETVTYMLAGSMEHHDHLGRRSLIERGGVQWVTAGRGIVQSAVPHQAGDQIWGIELWVNLPAKDKLCSPRYRDLPKHAISELELSEERGRVRVIAGSFGDVQGPVQDLTVEPVYLDVTLAPHASLEIALPETHNACIYVLQGSARFGDLDDEHTNRAFGHHDLGVLGPGDRVHVRAAPQGARFLVLSGRPLHEPVTRYGPFVMNTREQLQQAIDDYRTGRFLLDHETHASPSETEADAAAVL